MKPAPSPHARGDLSGDPVWLCDATICDRRPWPHAVSSGGLPSCLTASPAFHMRRPHYQSRRRCNALNASTACPSPIVLLLLHARKCAYGSCATAEFQVRRASVCSPTLAYQKRVLYMHCTCCFSTSPTVVLESQREMSCGP
jgi:hypothetical protein